MDRQYVGIDFHRRRSVIVRMSAGGARLGLHRIVNEPFEFVRVLAVCGESPEVVIEATYGWYWVVQLLQDLGATVHLANPRALNWGDRRVKNEGCRVRRRAAGDRRVGRPTARAASRIAWRTVGAIVTRVAVPVRGPAGGLGLAVPLGVGDASTPPGTRTRNLQIKSLML